MKKEKPDVPRQAVDALALAERIFGGKLAAVYLYGSAVLGGLRPDSDIDILLVIKSEMTEAERAVLTRSLLSLSRRPGAADGRPLEVSAVLLADLSPLKIPPRCEYMYGEWIRDEIEAGNLPQPRLDPDMVLLLRQAREYGKTLAGPEPCHVVPLVSDLEVRKAMTLCLTELLSGFAGDERNVLLTLARMWLTAETGEIVSKDEAASRIMSRLPQTMAPVLAAARSSYIEGSPFRAETYGRTAYDLAVFMQKSAASLLAGVK